MFRGCVCSGDEIEPELYGKAKEFNVNADVKEGING